MHYSAVLCCLLLYFSGISQQVYSVQTKLKKAAIPSTLWGLFLWKALDWDSMNTSSFAKTWARYLCQ